MCTLVHARVLDAWTTLILTLSLSLCISVYILHSCRGRIWDGGCCYIMLVHQLSKPKRVCDVLSLYCRHYTSLMGVQCKRSLVENERHVKNCHFDKWEANVHTTHISHSHTNTCIDIHLIRLTVKLILYYQLYFSRENANTICWPSIRY